MLGTRPNARERLGLLCAGLASLGLGCASGELGPAVEGRVIEAQGGAPVSGAVVVVRFDLRPDPRLPERDVLGHRETETDAEGRFRLAAPTVAGLAAWSRGGAEARVVGVIRDGYRCPSPRAVPASGRVTLELESSDGLEGRRASCRPLGSAPGEAPRYQAAWQALYPRAPEREEPEAPLATLLAARANFGHGENCTGPALDLALSPDGARVAIAVQTAGGRRVAVLRLQPRPGRVAVLVPPPDDGRRLGWVSDEELVLWEPGGSLAPPAAPSASSVELSRRTLWRRPGASASIEVDRHPRDLVDTGSARWQGRSFVQRRELDPASGFGIDLLLVSAPGRSTLEHRLPGEACGPHGQYGKPQLRVDASGARGLDLRFVEGGCHAISFDLESGRWQRLDPAGGPSECREFRRVPLGHLRRALGDYVAKLERALLDAEGDPADAWSLHIDPEGHTRLTGRDYMGGYVQLDVPDFPLATPLRRIDVTTVAGAASPPAAPATGVLEPL